MCPVYNGQRAISNWQKESLLNSDPFLLSHCLSALVYCQLPVLHCLFLRSMKLSNLAETLIGSEIIKLGGEIKERIRRGERIYNYTIGDFDPLIFPIPQELEDGIVEAYRQHFTNYPAAEGNLDLRESIALFLKDYQNLDYGLDEILVASGGRPLIYAIYRTICDKGEK